MAPRSLEEQAATEPYLPSVPDRRSARLAVGVGSNCRADLSRGREGAASKMVQCRRSHMHFSHLQASSAVQFIFRNSLHYKHLKTEVESN
jgi:hypothetical protein